MSKYKAYIAMGSSKNYPGINEGDLMFVDAQGKICYAFEVPNLKDYR